MFENARHWRLLAGGVAAGLAGVVGFAGNIASADPLPPQPVVPAPATVTQTVTVQAAPAPAAAAQPAGPAFIPAGQPAGVPQPATLPQPAVAQPVIAPAPAPVPAIAPAASGTIAEFFRAHNVAMQRQTAAGFTALTSSVVLMLPAVLDRFRFWSIGSVARAAEQLHRVPSNLTTRLRQLEQELGADLFIREKQRLRLSPMGHNFLCYANRILALSDEAMSITHAGEPAGNFALGSMESTAATRLPSLLAAYHQRFSQVSLSLTTGTSGEIADRVRAGTLAAALVDLGVPVAEAFKAALKVAHVGVSGRHAGLPWPRTAGETLLAVSGERVRLIRMAEGTDILTQFVVAGQGRPVGASVVSVTAIYDRVSARLYENGQAPNQILATEYPEDAA